MCFIRPEHTRGVPAILSTSIRRFRIPFVCIKTPKPCPYGLHRKAFSGAPVTMKLEKEMYEQIVENLHDGLYFVDTNRTITYWNKAAERISGFSAEEVVGRSCSDNMLTHVDQEGNSLCKGMCPLAETITDGKLREAHVYMHHKNGHQVPVSVRVSPLRDKDGTITGAIELFADISNLVANELHVKELKKLSYLDSLTQLANRRYIEKELQGRFDEKARYNTSFGVLFMDLDCFKTVNDTYGHDAGDKVLQFVANTLAGNSRPFDLYGRWGGEEFIGILRNVNAREVEILANRMRSLIEKAYMMYAGEKLCVTVSIGATLVRDPDSVESLLKRADLLLYKSKAAGRNCVTMD